jgi:hypothetical protein
MPRWQSEVSFPPLPSFPPEIRQQVIQPSNLPRHRVQLENENPQTPTVYFVLNSAFPFALLCYEAYYDLFSFLNDSLELISNLVKLKQ